MGAQHRLGSRRRSRRELRAERRTGVRCAFGDHGWFAVESLTLPLRLIHSHRPPRHRAAFLQARDEVLVRHGTDRARERETLREFGASALATSIPVNGWTAGSATDVRMAMNPLLEQTHLVGGAVHPGKGVADRVVG